MQNKINLLYKEKVQKQNRVWVRIASACNNKCIFCLDSDAQNWTFPDEEIIKKQLREWFKKWYENRAIISGWEASINPKFADYIKYAKNLWYDRVQTVTNWNMFAKEDFCKKVFDAWLEEVTFSFHWHNKILHDYLVATPWAFEKSIKWLIYIKKNYPHVIINIDIVVNRVNVSFLPDIVKFFIKLWVYEYDILHIIPFWRWFSEYKDKLFYDIWLNLKYLQDTWNLSRIPWVYIWTNRFPVEAFEWGYEDLIQDPRKIKSEVMWESNYTFSSFIESKWIKKPTCFWEACNYCFQKQYCHNFIDNLWNKNIDKWKRYLVINWENIKNINEFKWDYLILRWEEFLSKVYEKFWYEINDFKFFINSIINKKKIINLPKCLWWSWIYENYDDLNPEYNIWDYTKKYINNLYRKKSLNCKKCKYNNKCEWIHINFIRSYSFDILKPIL